MFLLISVLLFQMPEQLTGSLATQAPQLTPLDYFDPYEYILGPGDEVWLSFPGGVPFSGAPIDETISVVVIPIALNGILTIPTMPPLDTNGMNLADVQVVIGDLFRRSYGGMTVTSGLARSANFQIPVTGQINEPGIVTINGLMRLTDALDQTGGVNALGSLSRVLVISPEQDSTLYNLYDFLIEGNMGSNPMLYRNSRIHVFPMQEMISVEGALAALQDPSLNEITQTSIFLEYIPGENAREAIDRAGGVSNLASIESCYISRLDPDSTEFRVPIRLHEYDYSLLIEPGDKVVVPLEELYVNVSGQINRPGAFLYSPGRTVSYYVGQAGGLTGYARRNTVRMTVPGEERQDVSSSDLVPPGATLDVPRVVLKWWEDYLTIITGLATVIITYQSLSSQ